MICGKAQRPGSGANSGLPGFEGLPALRVFEVVVSSCAKRTLGPTLGVRSGASSFFDSLRLLAASCKRPFAKFWETQPIAGCCILVQQPLSALEGR